ncbi:MAG TPA: glucose 1-dehydrogenase [Chitinophagaceae bacterium]|nr:glucose 1-dehydrogenase [Chitinophagaceae bacterium]
MKHLQNTSARLAGKVAVITGGNSGIGLATAKAFIEEGAKVVIFGRDKKTLDDAAKTLGENAIAVQGDVTNTNDLDKLFTAATTAFGKVDILFANAGVAQFAPFEQTDEKLFDRNMDINVKGSFLTVQKALPVLNKKASVIFNTSVVNVKGFPGTSAYSASKAALRSLVRTLATELVGNEIRVNAVSPGPIDTPIFGRLGLSQELVEEMTKGFENANPMKRFGQPEEVAKTVLFFASDDSSYITGSEIAVDGGLSHL